MTSTLRPGRAPRPAGLPESELLHSFEEDPLRSPPEEAANRIIDYKKFNKIEQNTLKASHSGAVEG